MATHGVIIEKKAGHLLPQELIDGALDKYQSSVGMARVLPDGNFDLTREAKTMDPATLFKDQEKVKDEHVIFYFGRNSSPYVDDDLQPIPILQLDTGDIIAIGYLAGDFAEAPPKVSHTKEYLAVENYLAEKVSDLWELVDMDIDKLAEALDKPGTRKEICNTLMKDKTGTVVIMLYNGKVITYAQNPSRVTGEWGWATESCREVKQETKPATSGVPAVPATTMAAKIEAAKAAKAAAAEGKPVTADPAGPLPKTETAAVKTTRKVGPAPTHLKNEQKRAWWMKNAGFIPNGYKDPKCTAEVEVAQKIEEKAEPHVPKAVVSDALPIVPPYIRNAIIDDLKGVQLETAEEREKNQTEYANACSAVGYDMETSFKWSFGTMLHLATKYPPWFAILAYNYRNMFLREEALTEGMTAPQKTEAAQGVPAPEKKPQTMAEKIAAAKAAKQAA